MAEINGFTIDQYNVHGIPAKATTSTCPECSEHRKKKHEKCMSVFWDTGLGQCNHCGARVQLHTYKKNEEIKQYFKPVPKPKSNFSQKILDYFKNDRGISESTLNVLKISEGYEWMPKNGANALCIEFNYYFQGKLTNTKFRAAQKDFKFIKDAELIFYNLDNIIGQKECIIVEGEIDACSYVEAGLWNVVSVPNGFSIKGEPVLSYLDDYYGIFDNITKVYIATDNDEAGKKGGQELIRRIGSEKCLVVDFKDCKDANEYLLKYGKEELVKTLDEAKPVPLENVLTYKDVKEDLRNYYLNGQKRGFTIGLESFDKVFSTYTKQFIVVTGIPSSGKSDFVDQMAIGYNINYGWVTAFASGENKPTFLHANKLLRKLSGFTPRHGNTFDLERKGWVAAEEHLERNFNFIDYEDGFDLEKVLKKAEELVKRRGIKLLVIDPYNKIRLKRSMHKNVNDYTNDYLNEIDMFCKKWDLLIILVAHPVKMTKVKGSLTIPQPTFYDIKGGGEFYDMSPHGLLVHRDYDENVTLVKVLKVKFDNLGENNAEVYLGWNINSGRFNDLVEGFQLGTNSIGQTTWNNKNYLIDDQEQPVKPMAFSPQESIKTFEELAMNPIPLEDIKF